MNTSLYDRLTEALDDERKAIATYRRVIEKFGPVRPFVRIVQAEQRHADALLSVYRRYGLSVPENRWLTTPVPAPDSLQDACVTAIAGERENIAMYERLLAATPEPDVRHVLENLQAASRDRHLPAFERCASRQVGKHAPGGCGGGHRHRAGRTHPHPV